MQWGPQGRLFDVSLENGLSGGKRVNGTVLPLEAGFTPKSTWQ